MADLIQMLSGLRGDAEGSETTPPETTTPPPENEAGPARFFGLPLHAWGIIGVGVLWYMHRNDRPAGFDAGPGSRTNLAALSPRHHRRGQRGRAKRR